ncbi:MAG: polysaccharide deacetylase family protein [Acidobacteriota bacterium]|nr:polysaccharide deacetylase family protein [Acidobacteriota bacterium]
MNPMLKKLGFGPKDRVCIIHADDLGMSGRELPAFEDLLDSGLPLSGSVMAPCSGFEEVAAWAVAHEEADLGVHLTLTSEWDDWRWKPLTGGASLLDSEACLAKTVALLNRHAEPEDVRRELSAQIERVRNAGMKPTHLDCHMYTSLAAPFFDIYLDLALEWNLPSFIPREDPRWTGDPGYRRERVNVWEQAGRPIFDTLMTMKNRPGDRLEQAVSNITNLPVGLSYVLLHPVKPGGEPLTPDWHYREQDYEAFISPRFRDVLRQSDVQCISYKTLLQELPNARPE